jgi:hypothetical protein
MVSPGICPYCGGYNQPKRGQRHMDCALCGARLAIQPDGTLLPADATATPLDSDLAAPTPADSFTSPNAADAPQGSGAVLNPAPELLDQYFILHKSNRGIFSGEQTGQGALRLLMNISAGCTIIFLIPFVLAGLFVIGMFIKEVVDYNRLNSAGAIAEGYYIDSWINDDDDGTSYHVSYEYIVDGARYTDRISDQNAYNSFERGAPIRVRYWPGDPATSDLVEYPKGSSSMIFLGIFALIWNTFVWAMIYGILNRAIRDFRLHSTPQKQFVPGTLIKSAGRPDSDNDFTIRVKYEFTSPQTGKRIQRKDSSIRNDLAEQGAPPAGTPVLILYQSDRLHKLM